MSLRSFTLQKINKKIFFVEYKKQFGTLSQNQVNGLDQLLSFLENDKFIFDYRWAAYILATIHHETGFTYQPIKEKGSREYFIKRYGSQTKVGKSLGNDTPEEGAIYSGKGYDQKTGESNYETSENILRKEYPEVIKRFEERTKKKFDLTVGDQPNDINDPDNLLDAEISYYSMSIAMRKGLYTGVGLSKYIKGSICDFFNARKIINGLDCASKIESYARKFKIILEKSIKLM